MCSGCRRLCRNTKNEISDIRKVKFREFNAGDTIIAQDHRLASTKSGCMVKLYLGKVRSHVKLISVTIKSGEDTLTRFENHK